MKVMDYKTGSKTFDMVALYHGLQMQLMVYLNAAVKWEKEQHPEKEIVPAGVFYYRIQDPFVEAPKEKEEVETLLLKELKPDGMINLQDEVLLHLDSNQKGESLAVPVKYNLEWISGKRIEGGGAGSISDDDGLCSAKGGGDSRKDCVRR